MQDRLDGVVKSQRMSEEELKAVKALVTLCNAHDGLDLKLNLSPEPVVGDTVNHFLYYDGGTLLGFCSLDGGGPPEMEVCGMVHPDHRRHRIGRHLLDAAIAEWKPQGVGHFLLICEEASAAGRAFVETTGAKYESAEHHMEVSAEHIVAGRTPQPGQEQVVLERAAFEEVNHIARIMSSAFGGPPERLVGRIESDLRVPGERFYLARLLSTGEPVGTLKAILWEGKVGIYAFGVLAEYRGRGLGRQILTRTVDMLEQEGYSRFALEVETTNESAIGLYSSFGFKTTTTYGYYRLEI